MSYYVSLHPDYTDPRCPSAVDQPYLPYFIEADNARQALETTIDLAEQDEGCRYQTHVMQEETALVLLDPIFEQMRQVGWVINPPNHKSEEQSTIAASLL